MLTKIFTGHTLCLTDITAISGVMHELDATWWRSYRSQSVDIYLANGESFTHTHYTEQTRFRVTDEDRAVWQAEERALQAHIDGLVIQWEKALKSK